MRIRHITWEVVSVTCKQNKALNRTFKDAYIRFGDPKWDGEGEERNISISESTMQDPQNALYRKAKIITLTDRQLVAKAYWWSHRFEEGHYHEFPVEICAYFDKE